jgi:hypothetical protein
MAGLLGINGSLIGVYLSRLLLSEQAGGTALFMALAISFGLLAVYRTAFHRLLDVSGDRTCTL